MVSDGTNSASYGYLANSPLVSQIAFTNNGAQRLVTTKSYDNVNRLTASVSSSVASFGYAYNSANQRTSITNLDNSRWVYQYDTLGQVTSGKKYWSDNTPVAGEQFQYGFDDIGNRKTAAAGGDQYGANLRYQNYSANGLNQYTSRAVPGYFNDLGTANSNATVTLWRDDNSFAQTYRKGEFYRAELPVNNSTGALWLTLTNLAVLNNGTNSDIVTNSIGNAFVPQTPESFLYDLDGSLTNDGRWTYTWDGENRLINMTSLTNVPSASKIKLDFAYDCFGRRIQKIVSTWNGYAYVAQFETRFVYDGWNLLAEYHFVAPSTLQLMRTYTWGLDLSGTMQGAGGVGGLLAINDVTNGTQFVAYDGNGNVSALVKGSDGTVSANYELGPFGELIRSSGLMARANPFRFSTKYQDDETDMLYYGYRYYNPSGGRWMSRDFTGESSGPNIYAFPFNSLVNSVDLLGLWTRNKWSGGWGEYSGIATVCKGDTLEELARLITGNKSDASLLANTGELQVGQQVSIAPLLATLEQRMRANVLSAAPKLIVSTFGLPVTRATAGVSASDSVNRFFGDGKGLLADCWESAQILLAKGLLDTIGSSDFDSLGYQFNKYPKTPDVPRQLSDVKVGDWIRFKNYPEYPNGWAWQGENVVKMGEDLYWGLTASGQGSVKSASMWLSHLQTMFNAQMDTHRTDPLPGFEGWARFVDVPKVGMNVFDLRRGKLPR